MKHQSIKSEVKIGLMIVTAFALFIWGLNYLKGVNLFKPSNYYYVSYANVDGLVKSSPVMLDGFQVGLVRAIQYQYNKPGHIIVTLGLNRKLKLPSGTSAVLKPALMGNPTIELALGDQTTSMMKEGDTLIALTGQSLLDQLSNGVMASVESAVKRADSLMTSIEALVNNGNLSNSLASIEKTTAELEKLTGNLNKTMNKDIPPILNNINDVTYNLSGLSNQLNAIDIAGSVAQFDQLLGNLNGMTSQLRKPDNTLGLLLNDSNLYINLNNTATSAHELLLDLKKQPKRYVHFSLFGGSNK